MAKAPANYKPQPGDQDTSVHAERFPMPLNGDEIKKILAKIAHDTLLDLLMKDQDLTEARAFSRANIQFGFGLKIELWPQEEGRTITLSEEVYLDYKKFPPDVLRILTGEEIWSQATINKTGETADIKHAAKPQLAEAVKGKFDLKDAKKGKGGE